MEGKPAVWKVLQLVDVLDVVVVAWMVSFLAAEKDTKMVAQ